MTWRGIPAGRRLVFGAALLSLTLLGVGCGEDDDGSAAKPAAEAAAEAPAPPPAKAKKAEKDEKAEKAPPADGAPDAEGTAAPGEAAEEGYNPVGKRDPFKNTLAEQVVEEKRPVTPLQKFELDNYQVTGVFQQADGEVALVEDPEGNGHFVRVGTLIGKNWGKVVRITPDSIVVAEELRDFEGKLVVNEVVLSLASLDGGTKKKK